MSVKFDEIGIAFDTIEYPFTNIILGAVLFGTKSVLKRKPTAPIMVRVQKPSIPILARVPRPVAPTYTRVR